MKNPIKKLKAKRRAARNKARATAFAKIGVSTAANVAGGRLLARGIARTATPRASATTISMVKGRNGVWRTPRSIGNDMRIWGPVYGATGALTGFNSLNRKEKKQLNKDFKSAKSSIFGPPKGSLKYKFTAARKAALRKAQKASARLRGN